MPVVRARGKSTGCVCEAVSGTCSMSYASVIMSCRADLGMIISISVSLPLVTTGWLPYRLPRSQQICFLSSTQITLQRARVILQNVFLILPV